LRAHDLYDRVSQEMAVFLPVRSVAVMEDGRRHAWVIALRAVETVDFMTAHWSRLPYDFLDVVARRLPYCRQAAGDDRVGVADIKSITFILWFASAMAAFAAPAAANEFDHVWSCELKPDKTLDDARAVARAWLAAARSMRHGERLQVSIRYPIIVTESENRFEFVVSAPSLAVWGAFYDTYDDGTPVADADLKFADVASCSGSTMWESIDVQ
jgi:hypothetical protein